MISIRKKILAALAVALSAVSCTQVLEPAGESEPSVGSPEPVFTITATIGDRGTKVSYEEELNGETSKYDLYPSWEVGDRVVGFDDSDGTYGFEVSEISGDGKATLVLLTAGTGAGSVVSAPADGTNLHLIYAPGKTPSDIDGRSLSVSIASQSKNVVPALMMAEGTVADGELSIAFHNKTVIIALKNPAMASKGHKYSSIALSSPGDLNTEVLFSLDSDGSIKAEYGTPGTITKEVSFTSDSSTGKGPEITYIVACPVETPSNLLFTVPETGERFGKSGRTMAGGRYYYMTPTFAAVPDYLCFTAREDNVSIKLQKNSNVACDKLEYSTDGVFWEDLDVSAMSSGEYRTLATLSKASERLYVRAKEARTAGQTSDAYIRFASTGGFDVSGNVTYLIDPTGSSTTLSQGCEFSHLFMDCTALVDASGLSLPATTLSKGCYYGLFRRCTGLSAAPALRARATADWCYSYMFYGCSNISRIECMASSLDGVNKLYCWAEGVASSGVFICAAGVDWPVGRSGIPLEWAKNTVLPEPFSVSATKQVYFSGGNLRATYTDSGYTWGFAPAQYEIVGGRIMNSDGEDTSKALTGNNTIDSQTEGAVVDLFGWSTDEEGSNWGIRTSTENADYSGSFKDWGTVVPPYNWRTLSSSEWSYLVGGRGSSDKFVRSGVSVAGIGNCFVIAPDGNETSISASYSEYEWAEAEKAGFLCLPAACYRYGNYLYADNFLSENGNYWSSTKYSVGSSNRAWCFKFPSMNFLGCDKGLSVRLVIDADQR